MRILMPLPHRDFDPSETSIPWRSLTAAGIEVVFATPDGEPGEADPRMLDGVGLGLWKPLLRAGPRARRAYAEMVASERFQSPLSWDELSADDFHGLLLPGGHAKGMRPYLESKDLQSVVAEFMRRRSPVGAICHGVVLLARSRVDGRSAIDGRRVTALLKSQELSAYGMTALWLGDYYRTYPTTVEDEVREALGDHGHFEPGPFPLLRDDPEHLSRGFTVHDDHLVTARWPGDAHRFAREFGDVLTTSHEG
jgi:putative intracellular protease/amidase